VALAVKRTLVVVALAATTACGSGSGAPVGDRTLDGGSSSSADGGSPPEGADASSHDAAQDVANEGGAAAPGPFITSVVSFSPTDCAGFGVASMPGIVEGPPVGGGTDHGSTDVVSLGCGGSIVVSFAPNAIVDGPGADFIVFENPFWIADNSNNVYAEPGEVSVSDDGVSWTAFPCAPTVDPQASDGTGTEPPYGQCAGWHAVYSTPQNGISPTDPVTAGGDAFDLSTIGVARARYVKIVDHTSESCPAAGADKPDTNGFDLDAIAIVHVGQP
jgi:hypothetical protein